MPLIGQLLPLLSEAQLSGQLMVYSADGQAVGNLLYPLSSAEIAAGFSQSSTNINYIYPIGNVFRYGATGNGITDDTAAIQLALNVGGATFLPSGVYLVSSTLTAKPDAIIYGISAELTKIYRTGNYGDTIICGNNSGLSAAGFQCYKIWFQHSSPYVPGSVTLPNLATSGAHIRLYGPQQARIHDCYFWRLPYGISQHGGSISYYERNTFTATWDPTLSGVQEGLASLNLDSSSTWGHVKDVFIYGNEFLGTTQNARAITLTDGFSHSQTPTFVPNIGPQNSIFSNGTETLHIQQNYIGGASLTGISINTTVSPAFSAETRIINNFLDGAGAQCIFAQVANTSANPILNFLIEDNTFNGELSTPSAIKILANSSTVAAYNLHIKNNSFNAFYASPMILTGAIGYQILGNIVTNYNCYGVTPVGGPFDSQWCAAAWIASPAANNAFGLINDNSCGGGGNNFGNTGNFCWQGFQLDTALTTIRLGRTFNLGIGPNARVGITEEGPTVITSNFTCSGSEGTIFCNNGAAITITLERYALAGTRRSIKDINNAASFNITVAANTSESIEGSSTKVINTQYGLLRLESNGGGVWFQV